MRTGKGRDQGRGGGPRALAGTHAGVFTGQPGPRSGLADWWHGFAASLHAWSQEEARQRRLFLWLPVFFGAGVLLYFAASHEPSLWAPALAALAAGAAARTFARRQYVSGFRVSMALLFLFAGFLAGCLRTAMVSAPVLQRMTIAKVTAYVEAIDFRNQGARLVLRSSTIEHFRAGQTPERIRVTMRWRPDFAAGATITATLRLLPPVQSEPGGYNFAKDAFFQRIGAVGNLVSRPQLAPAQAVPILARLNAWIDRGRNTLTERIASVIGGANGAVAAALVTGKRGTIPESANEDLRAAGIYHIVSISGLHMVLAAGLFLWAMRALLALFPALALSRPIKVWSALFAMAGATAYCLFSGAEVATQRALIMTLVMLGAVLAGRPAISMRNLAIAALLVMTLEPNALTGPSFQMSFAAVAAMIAAFERRADAKGASDPWGMRPVRDDPAHDLRADPVSRILLILAVMAITTLVASLATDPYALYHFHRITPYGLLGNMLVLPLVEFVVMPCGVIGVIAAAFGLDGPVWWLMGQGVAWMMAMARWVASLQGSVILLPAFGAGALLLMTMGLLWLTLWQTPLRWAGIAVAAAGIWLASQSPKPDLIVSGQGRIAAYRNAQGTLDVLNARANRFGAAQWLASDADKRKADRPGLSGKGRCDRQGCTGQLRDGRILALTLTRAALLEDCGRADIVITPLFAQGLCKGPEKVLDRTWLQAHGAARMVIQPDGALNFETARTPRYDRPWSRLTPAAARWPATPRTATPGAGLNSSRPSGWTKAQ